MTKRNIIKIVLSVAGGLIIGSLGTIIIISQTQHVLTEEEYKEYNTLNDKKKSYRSLLYILSKYRRFVESI